MGGGQILRWELAKKQAGGISIDIPKWAGRVVQAVKEGKEEEIACIIRRFAQEIRESHANRNRSIIYMQNLLLSVIGSANLMKDKENAVVQEEKEFLNRIYEYDHLTDMAVDVIAICGHISGL